MIYDDSKFILTVTDDTDDMGCQPHVEEGYPTWGAAIQSAMGRIIEWSQDPDAMPNFVVEFASDDTDPRIETEFKLFYDLDDVTIEGLMAIRPVPQD